MPKDSESWPTNLRLQPSFLSANFTPVTVFLSTGCLKCQFWPIHSLCYRWTRPLRRTLWGQSFLRRRIGSNNCWWVSHFCFWNTVNISVSGRINFWWVSNFWFLKNGRIWNLSPGWVPRSAAEDPRPQPRDGGEDKTIIRIAMIARTILMCNISIGEN